jgi:hypothetical protein
MSSKVPAVLVLVLLATTVSLPTKAAMTANGLFLTVYPDGSVKVAFDSTQSTMLQPGTQPDVTSHVRATTSGGQTTITVNETVSLPAKVLSQAPYNYSASISSSGSYLHGVSKGSLVVQTVPGVSFPGAAMTVSYHGDSNSISVSGNTTLQYGAYGSGSSRIVLNATTISQDLQRLQSEGFNSSNIQKVLTQLDATLPHGDFSLASFTLGAVYGTNSATVSGDLRLTGNMTALPFLIAQAILLPASRTTTSTTTMSTSTESTTTSLVSPSILVLGLFSAFSAVSSSIHEYTYKMSYASGIMALSLNLNAAQNLNLNQAMKLFARYAVDQGAPDLDAKFLNTTRVDISGLSANVSETQKASGEYDMNIAVAGLTVYPQVVKSGGMLNESGLFNFLGASPANVTVTGGTNAEGSASIVVPASISPPTSSSGNSKTWAGAHAKALAGLEFSVEAITSSTTSSSISITTTQGATSSTTSASGGGGIPEFPIQLGLTLLITIAIVTSYVLARRGLQIGRQPSF